MPKLEDLAKEAKNLGKEAKQILTPTSRAFKDFVNPPSTFEQIKRAVQDFWSSEIEPSMSKLDGTAKKGLQDFKKSFEEFQKDPNKTQEDIAKFFKDESTKCKEISNSPILKKFGEFLSNVGTLVKAVATGKEITESWQKFKESAAAVGSAIKEATLGKGKEGMTR
jgi:hypothetical protein